MERIEICLIHPGETPKICPKCKNLNNKRNTVCINCEERLKEMGEENGLG